MGSRSDGRTQMPPPETGVKKLGDLSENTNMPNWQFRPLRDWMPRVKNLNIYYLLRAELEVGGGKRDL